MTRLLLVLSLTLTGCYASKRGSLPTMQRAADSRELYCDPEFSSALLRRDRVTSLAARVSVGNEALRQALGQGLIEKWQEQLGDALVHPHDAVNRINEAGLTSQYAAMLATYDQTNMLEAKSMESIARAVQVRYFAMPILVNFNEDLATRFSIFGMRLAKTASANARFQLQIWDGHHGRIVWEGLADLTLGQDTMREERIRLDDALLATWESLIQQIPATPPTAQPEA